MKTKITNLQATFNKYSYLSLTLLLGINPHTKMVRVFDPKTQRVYDIYSMSGLQEFDYQTMAYRIYLAGSGEAYWDQYLQVQYSSKGIIEGVHMCISGLLFGLTKDDFLGAL